ncbi:hypothetical protein GOBAR_DD14425 [Gossypium barbadense]|nr:hypothetical protein GOBAR_DD14425 [Gossypium barbadense]
MEGSGESWSALMGISYGEWGGSTESVHNHLVKWNQVCRFKSQGGLGLRKARLNNLAMLAKAGWRLHTNQDAVWCQVFRQK